MSVKAKMKKVFDESVQLLNALCPNQIELKDFFQVPQWKGDVRKLFYLLVYAIHERSMMPGIIKLDDEERKQKISKILFLYDPEQVLNNYDEYSLFSAFCSVIEIKNSESKNNLWLQFCKSIISIAKFLKKFDFDTYKFDKYIQLHDGKELMLIDEFVRAIYGVQFALASNVLKNLGYVNYLKPDTHLIKVFVACGLVNETPILDKFGNKKFDKKGNHLIDIPKLNQDVFLAALDMAKIVGVSPRTIDITIWLVCRRPANVGDKIVGGKRDELIKRCT